MIDATTNTILGFLYCALMGAYTAFELSKPYRSSEPRGAGPVKRHHGAIDVARDPPTSAKK